MKINSDSEWLKALEDVWKLGKSMDKQVVVHTHFSSHHEITEWSRKAMEKLYDMGILVRNQAVLQRGGQ